ncbi:ABC transporter ATP-binding protein [Spirochaeta thermophila]|uniref:Transporter n=1 Tax=Winmispira thermophila (strain ATCC 49972 / DSM 6192 / RI 19.B1) TaxID=665571 RepID=E0RQB5_WINT6|nr:ABC transporter ATP-binding protein [Spirochaeta thermophila]ADN02891.1 transporter [Spirochaeta thermophila DSM 6192]
MTIVHVEGLRRTYQGRPAVDGITFSVDEGRIVGLIGPDGAGKTTTMRLILGLDHPEEGIIQLPDEDHSHWIKRHVGYMPERFSLYEDLTVEENLWFFATVHGLSEAHFKEKAAWLYRFSRLAPFRTRRAGALSGGMKQKLALSCALLHNPRLLILDEPTTGVDPLSRKEFWDMLDALRREGMGILISTPNLGEAEHCDTVLFLHEGKIVLQGSPQQLSRRLEGRLFRIETEADPRALREEVRRTAPHIPCYLGPDGIRITGTREELAPLLSASYHLEGPLPPRLEDAFLSTFLGISDREAV